MDFVNDLLRFYSSPHPLLERGDGLCLFTVDCDYLVGIVLIGNKLDYISVDVLDKMLRRVAEVTLHIYSVGVLLEGLDKVGYIVIYHCDVYSVKALDVLCGSLGEFHFYVPLFFFVEWLLPSL